MFEVPREFLDSDDYKKTMEIMRRQRDADDVRVLDEYANESLWVIFMDMRTELILEISKQYGVDEYFNDEFIVNLLVNECDDEWLSEYLHESIKLWCKRLTISVGLFSELMRQIAILILSENNDAAFSLFRVAMYPYTLTEELRMAPVNIGKKGGRPAHNRKEEAIEIAKKFISKNSDTDVSGVSVYVYSELKKKYNDIPKLSSIQFWVKTCMAES